MKKLLWAALLAVWVVCAPGAWAQGTTSPVVGTVIADERAEQVRLKTFEVVWRTVKEKHFDPTLGGVDWERVRQQYEPRAAAAADNAALYRVLQAMLGELHQSHFNIIPPEAITPDDQREVGGGIGIDVRLLDGVAVITRIAADSPAARAGLRLGFVLTRIGEKSVDEIVNKASAPTAMATDDSLTTTLRRTRRVLGELAGEPGSAIKVGYLDALNEPHEATLTRAKLPGEIAPRLGAFPPQYTEFETRRFATAGDGGSYFGYIRFNIFTLPVVTKLRQAVAEFNDAAGLIFDLRGNPGGVGGIAMSLGGLLAQRPGSLGTMKLRASEVRFAINPQRDSYDGPVVLLLDGLSASTSELLAAGLQEMGRAVVIGERSLGACLPSYLQKLPTGALFQFAIADFRTPKGVLVEGRGVQPDIVVRLERTALLAGRDTQLEAARAKLTELRRNNARSQ